MDDPCFKLYFDCNALEIKLWDIDDQYRGFMDRRPVKDGQLETPVQLATYGQEIEKLRNKCFNEWTRHGKLVNLLN
jgi:hypothetical protein